MYDSICFGLGTELRDLRINNSWRYFLSEN